EHEQEWQPAVKPGQETQEERVIRDKHVIGHAGEREAGNMREKIDDPDDLRHQDSDRAHRDEEGAFGPDSEQREKQAHVAEIKKVRWAVPVKIGRHQHCHEGAETDFHAERNASGLIKSCSSYGHRQNLMDEGGSLNLNNVHLSGSRSVCKSQSMGCGSLANRG